MAKREIGGWLSRVGLLALLAAVAVQLGCQPGSNEELKVHRAISQTPPEKVATVGIDVCGVCHTRQVEEWLTGQHGTASVFDPLSPLDSVGHPTYAQLYQSDGTPNQTSKGNYCYECHDQLGDGRRLQEGYTGNVDRPVISCESCHGGGAQHFGVGNIPFPKPDASRCGQCHNKDFDHEQYHPNAANIYEDYTVSGHAISINDHNLTNGGTQVRALCSRCHTDENFRKYVSQVPGTTGHDSLEDFFTGLPNLDLADASDVTCRTCHDPHEATGEDLTRVMASVVNGNTQSSEFNTCTSCHQLVNDQGTVLTGTTVQWAGTVGDSEILNGDSFAYHDPKINQYSNYHEIISDTHAAVPGDTRVNVSGGATVPERLKYVKKGDNHSCSVCHNQHSTDLVQNRAWEKSGHGDTGDNTPWNHYPWKDMGSSSSTGRQECQRCHTTTGFMNFANMLINGGTVYTPLGTNDFSYLAANQYETLYCWGCHASRNGTQVDYKGKLRNPGRLPTSGPLTIKLLEGATVAGQPKLLYPNLPMSGDTTFPDVDGSNVCLSCHSGRENGEGIFTGTVGVNWGGTASIRPPSAHHLVAGGVLYREIGYEYYPHDGVDGDTINPNYTYSHFKHYTIGTPAAGTTVDAIVGTNGPCVGCHMHANGDDKHRFTPVILNGSTETLNNTACSACHTGTHVMTLESLDENETEYLDSLAALKRIIDAGTLTHPRTGFKTGRTSDTATNWTRNYLNVLTGDSLIAHNNMGASFNYTTLGADPGAFAHNRYYTKRLIYDSIDWLDDNQMNQSVAATLPDLGGPITGDTLSTVQGYLLKNGIRP